MMLTTAGIAIGLLGAYWLTGMMKTLVFGVTPADPWTFVAGAVVLLGAAWLASYVPARRAARVDPVIAMRAE